MSLINIEMENKIKSMAVFCSSAIPKNPIYEQSIRQFGRHAATQNITLVYGGASVGLMGAMADAAIEKHGKVIGVIPSFFSKKEIAHANLTELVFVSSMPERKQVIADNSDAFVVFPGGFGTLDEMFEMLTFSQLDFHQKPLILFNINGFFDDLIKQLEKMNVEGFIRDSHYSGFVVANSIEDVFSKAENHKVMNETEWLKWAKIEK